MEPGPIVYLAPLFIHIFTNLLLLLEPGSILGSFQPYEEEEDAEWIKEEEIFKKKRKSD